MFDPTAYENLKVVLEGLVYDYDLNGNIVIIERNDYVNLADLSRSFNILFVNKRDKRERLRGKVELSATFNQLAAEWMLTNEEPGCRLAFHFFIQQEMNEILEKRLLKLIKQTYGNDFHYRWRKIVDSEGKTEYDISVEKLNPVTEKTVDELPDFIEKTVECLRMMFEMMNS